MSMISNQIDELKNTEKVLREHNLFVSANNVREAIDTIKALSAKVRKLNIGVTNSEIKKAIKVLEKQQNEFNDNWVDYGGVNKAYGLAIIALGKQYDAYQTHNLRTETHGVCSDLISRQEAIEKLECIMGDHPLQGYGDERLLIEAVESLPSEDRPTGEWTTEQVAELLANLFGDECACNYNGNDGWLPSACKYADTQCPGPKEKHGCWMQFLIQGGGTSE